MILILKISSIFVTALLGILSLLFNFRDEKGKITHQGKMILSVMLLSFFISIITTITESFQSTKDAQEQLAKTIKVLHEFSRTQAPITRAEITYYLELPQSNASVFSYSKFVDRLVMANADQFLDKITSAEQLEKQSTNRGLKAAVMDANGDPIIVHIDINSKYWPSEDYEDLAATASSYAFSLYIKKENVSPEKHDYLISTEPGYSDFIALPSFPFMNNKLLYNYQEKKLFIYGSQKFDSNLWYKNGIISSIVDLSGVQIFLRPSNFANSDSVSRFSSFYSIELKKKLKDLANSISINNFMISLSDGHKIWIDGRYFRKTALRSELPLFSVILPTDINKFSTLRKD